MAWLQPEIVTPTSAAWCSREAAEIYLRTDSDDDEAPLLDGMIEAAGAQVEAITGLRLMPQTVELKASSFADLARLPIGPVRSVTSVEYRSQDGQVLPFDSAAWRKTGGSMEAGVAVMAGNSWPSVEPREDAIIVTVEVGYESADAIPAPVRQACFLLLGDFYLHREDSGKPLSAIPNGVMALLCNYRRFS